MSRSTQLFSGGGGRTGRTTISGARRRIGCAAARDWGAVLVAPLAQPLGVGGVAGSGIEAQAVAEMG